MMSNASQQDKPTLAKEGYEFHRGLLDEVELSELRAEADRITGAAGSACLRHLRDRSARFDALSVSSAVLSLLPPGMRPVKSILFDKTEAENWPVAWHRDLTIAVARKRDVPGYGPWSLKEGIPHAQAPLSLLRGMLTVRLHLDDTPGTNGALRVIPGSHLLGGIDPEGPEKPDKSLAVTCECGPGDVLLMSPLILHSSRRSEAPGRRRVVHIEYAREGHLDPRLDWFERPTD